MTTPSPKIRLFVGTRLHGGGKIVLEAAQCHYLANVMRCRLGDEVGLFNGRDGEWLGQIASLAKRRCEIGLLAQIKQQPPSPDLWLVFAPVKKQAIDTLAAKATELGVSRLQPVITERTNIVKINAQRLRAQVIEAAEQCRRLDLPEISAPVALTELLAAWPEGRFLIFCDESGKGQAPAAAFAGSGTPAQPAALLIGPEGGFSENEANLIRGHKAALAISLGPRILRADTAALAGLAVWQALRGDWSGA
jgi:16S rRNA (uracil1498-N3)-methyltransferase